MISDLTLGTAQLGLKYGINNKSGKPTIEKSLNILEYAYSHGIRSFDTAQAYGDSESILGQWLDKSSYKDIYITSKIPSMNQAKVATKDVYAYLEKSIYTSLVNLKIDTLDNIMLHDFTDLIIYKEKLVNSLYKLKEAGYVKEIGCSIYENKSMDIMKHYDFDSIQFPSSIFNQGLLEDANLESMRGKTVKIKTFIRSAFLQGLIFMNPDKLVGSMKRLKPFIIELNQLAKSYHISIAEIALNFLRKHVNVDSVVFGVDNVEQLKEILGIPNRDLELQHVIKEQFKEIPCEWVDPRKWRGDSEDNTTL